MFVVSKKNILLPGPGGEIFRMEKEYMGPLPPWAEGSAYLKALVADGKVILSARGTEKEFSSQEKRGKKGKPPAEEEP